MKVNVRVTTLAVAVGAMLALAPTGPVKANDFTDACVKGSGLFDDAGCKCLEGKVTDSGDKATMIAYFKIQADAMNGKTPSSSDATSNTMSKGTELVSKYSGECMK
jgi:RNA recognition motif-containing protein